VGDCWYGVASLQAYLAGCVSSGLLHFLSPEVPCTEFNQQVTGGEMILNNKRYGSDYGPSTLSRQASFMKRTSTILLLAALLATITYRLYCKALVVFNPSPDHSDLFETFKWEDVCTNVYFLRSIY
jgi:hypothetical protein